MSILFIPWSWALLPNLLENLVKLFMQKECGISGNGKATGQFWKTSNMGVLQLIGKRCLISVELILSAVLGTLSVPRRFKEQNQLPRWPAQ